ncbi:serine/threonine protein kinase [Gordonia sp. NPDC003429]
MTTHTDVDAEPDTEDTAADDTTLDAGAATEPDSGAPDKPKKPKKNKNKKSKGAESAENTAPAAAPEPEKRSVAGELREYLNPRRHPVITAMSALCVAALIAVAVLASLLVTRSDDLTAARTLAQDKATAETVAGKYAVGAATFDYKDLKPWSASLKKGTAPELNSRFDVAVSTLTPLIQEVQWSQTAKLIAAKTVDIRSDRQFVVQVFVSTHMTSTQNPKGLNTVTPYTITLDRDDNWLITDVAGIAGAAQDGSAGDGTPDLAPQDSTGGGGDGGGQTPAAPAPPTP